MKVSAWVKAGRERLGWSQRDLAKAVRVSPGAVGQWETDAVRPKLPNLLDMAVLFQTSIGPLLGPGGDYPGELVEDEEELLVLNAWRRLTHEHRQVLRVMLQNAVTAQDAAAATSPVERPAKRGRRPVGAA